MQFKDLKQNYPVYILDKEKVSFITGKVLSVSFPHIDNSNPMSMGKTVVDVVIEADGKTATYAIPENMSIASANNIVLSTDRDGLCREVEAMKNNAELIINSVDRQHEIIKKSKELLAELNPVFKEKQQYEQRMTNMEKSIEGLQDMKSSVEELKAMMQNFIKGTKG